jgi:hypothetical protein
MYDGLPKRHELKKIKGITGEPPMFFFFFLNLLCVNFNAK